MEQPVRGKAVKATSEEKEKVKINPGTVRRKGHSKQITGAIIRREGTKSKEVFNCQWSGTSIKSRNILNNSLKKCLSNLLLENYFIYMLKGNLIL
jgi:hypothetical protein